MFIIRIDSFNLVDAESVETLMECGLSKSEARVYLALVSLGSAGAAEITKKSRVHRVNVYDTLDRLSQKGLISTVTRASRRLYTASNPSQLQLLLSEKEKLLSQIMPKLSEEFKETKTKQQVYHFFGPEGVLQAYYMALKSGAKNYYSIGPSGLNRQYLKHRHHMFNRDRLKQRVHLHAVTYESLRNVYGPDTTKDSTVHLRYMPDEFKGLCSVDVAGDIVINLLPIKDNVMAIVIENKDLANSYRNFFEFMWKNAKP